MSLTLFEVDLPPIRRRIAKFVIPSVPCSLKDVVGEFIPSEFLTDENILVSCNGRIQDISGGSVLPGAVYRIVGKLLGGKGGFGSLLRAIGMQIEKTKNKEACRDLSGRRMRDINNEKKLKEWFSKAADRMIEKEHRKRDRRERLLQEPKHMFDDQNYMHQKEEVIEEMEAALQAGMEKARKRAQRQSKFSSENDGRPSSKKLKSIDAWAGVDISALSSSSDSESSSTSSNLSDLPPPDLSLSSEDEAGPSGEKTQEGGNKKAEGTSIAEPEKTETSSTGEGKGEKVGDRASKTEKPPVVEQTFDPIDLEKVVSLDDLTKFGLDHLKAELRRRNMKCGGTLEERAKRLWEVKHPPPPVKKVPEKPSKSSKKTKSK